MRKLIPTPLIVTAIAASLIVTAIACFGADEITVSANLTITSGAVSQSQKSGDLRLDMYAAQPVYNAGVTVIGTAWTSLPVGAVTSNGFLWVKNTSTNIYISPDLSETNAAGNWISIGVTNAGAGIVSFSKLYAGEVGTFPLDPAAGIYLQAVTSNIPAQLFLITR
jgi:hypothetical protein